MKRNVKKMLALAIAGIMTIGCVAGCGKGGSNKDNKDANSSTDIEIKYWQAGLGTVWLENLIEAFNEKYPEYNVYYSGTADNASIQAGFGFEDVDTVDLYLSTIKYDEEKLEPLNDVLDTTIEGEGKSIKEKFDPSYLALVKKGDNYYNLTYGGGVEGFVYNKKLFEQAGIETIPRTTDELGLVCSTLDAMDIIPLCHCAGDGYYSEMNEVWWAQYNGIDYYRDFYMNPSKDKMLAKDGRYETIKVHEKINTPDYVLQGSNSENHIAMQTKFLQGKAAMMANGSWLANEMNASDKMDDFAMMKTPVISRIIDKLDTVKDDKNLRKLISAIDNVTDGKEKIETYKDGENYKIDGTAVSSKDWEYVKAARNMTPANYSGHAAFIPSYCNAKEGAKDFLRFMYSDEGYQIYLDSIHMKMPLELSDKEIDMSAWTSFEKNQADLLSSTEYFVCKEIIAKNRIFVDGGALSYIGATFVSKMCSRSEIDHATADETWKLITETIDEKYESWEKNVK